jgi:3-hydroxyisobutyrate dehydrogenase-like beta-hydroxyacid dehydrogenase
MKIALIGLGKMGGVLAKRILQAGFDLTVFNRTAAKMDPLTALGAKSSNSAKEAVADADIVVTCLLDDNVVLQIVQGEDGFLHAMKSGAIHIGTSTILPATSKILAKSHQDNGSIYIAGNVLGIPKVAEKGELTTIVAGPLDVIEQCKPVIQCYSSTIINAGTKAFQANVIKICSNYMLATSIEVMGELYTFAEKSEVDLSIIHTLFHSIYAHPGFKLYVDKIKNRDFDEANFALSVGFKDLHLFQQAFTDVRVVPDIANVIASKFIIALAQGMADKDWSAITEITRDQAGLK